MEEAYWADEQESGPPTVKDDAWFQHHVVSKGYPKVKREPKQLPGQQKLVNDDDTYRSRRLADVRQTGHAYTSCRDPFGGAMCPPCQTLWEFDVYGRRYPLPS